MIIFLPLQGTTNHEKARMHLVVKPESGGYDEEGEAKLANEAVILVRPK